MQLFKYLIVALVAFTAGEFINDWRSQTEPTTLWQFIKNYPKYAEKETRRARLIGELAREGKTDEAKEQFKLFMFPDRKQG